MRPGKREGAVVWYRVGARYWKQAVVLSIDGTGPNPSLRLYVPGGFGDVGQVRASRVFTRRPFRSSAR